MKLFLSSLLLLSGLPAAAAVRHDLAARLDPASGAITAEDTVYASSRSAEFVFTLHKGLKPAAKTGALEELGADTAARYGINLSSAADIYTAYRLTLPRPSDRFTISYSGAIRHAPGEQAQDYARSFSETPGVISEAGCYLSGASGWYPGLGNAMVSFRLKTDLPAPYDSVAGGARSSRKTGDGRNISVWETAAPQDEIAMTCGRYSEYSRTDGPLTYQAFLLSPDKALADKYLEATGRYIKLYSDLIGPYPYGKFALVENFWETGYGMPSFTLLGPKVLRLPFILNSSYPHEILHNWWGNSVFVDYESGNWCEGLTAYLADYLIAENRGKGADYRMTTLQKYSDYVRGGADFPLTAFRSRHSSASEAIGYGKSLMFYHMLRNLLGDDNFRKGLRRFYSDNKFRAASFSGLREAFEKITGPGRLKPFFDQWLTRTGAPALAVKSVNLTRGQFGYDLEFTLAQTQDGPPYELEVPSAIYLDGVSAPRMKTLSMKTKEETYHYNSAMLRPARLEIDPEFDLFRRLSPLETPPTLSRLLGAARPLIVLPAGQAGAPWRALAEAWTKDKENLPVVSEDIGGSSVPASSCWVFGGGSRLAADFEASLGAYGAVFTADSVTLENRRFPRAGHTFVFAAYNPSDPALSAALVLSDAPDKLPLLAAKLPHYGKYSWLVFDENMNSAASGTWRPSSSPLAVDLTAAPHAPRAYPSRQPLAQVPSAFSEPRIRQDIRALSAVPGGRAPGAPGHREAKELVNAALLKAGLKPYAGPGLMLAEAGPGRGNVVGLVEGTSKKDEYVVLSAHYDHLPAKDGQVFPGADDNASGVALLLELARWYGGHRPERSLIFAAFDGEEAGRTGSKDFAGSLAPGLKSRVNAALNFDTVGRLGNGKILVLGSSSSDKWVHIFRGAGFVTGSAYDLVKEDLDSSDQASFIEAGIPAVQFFSGPNPDYHKTSDTADKIDAAGIVRQAEFAKEIIDYLAGGSDFITRPSGAPAAAGAAGTRRASTGLVPDFSFAGPGVRAQDVTPGSPLAKTAFRPGDVITALDGVPVDGLKAYSEALKKISPGQKVTITFLSGGKEHTVELEPGSR